MKPGWYNVVYTCKLCNKQIVDIRPTESVSDDDMNKDLENLHDYSSVLDENTKLHNQIDKSDCYGLISIIGFQYRGAE